MESQNTRISGRATASWSLQRNNAGQITTKNENIAGVAATYEYGYDNLSRLTTVTRNSVPVEEYEYDQNGNRTSETNTARNLTGRGFTYSEEDQIMTAGEASFEHDLDGFLTTKTVGADVTRYKYSSRGELLQVTLADGKEIEYLYDPLRRRIAKKVDGIIVEKYLWQDPTRLLAIYDDADRLLMRFEYADDRMPAIMTKEGATYYLAYDQVGSPRVVTDAAGNVVKKIDYDSFGNKINDTNPAFTIPFGFAGGLLDQDTGLVLFGYRDYDPDLGRWTAKDPIGFAGGDTNLYGYCLNDPVNWIDPLGLYTEVIIWQPVGHGSSSFGHVSSNVNGTNYSWGPRGWDTNPSASNYVQNQQKFRSGVGVILNLTPDQERKLVECYAKKREEYSSLSNNCGDPHKDCLSEALGASVSDSLFLVNIGNDLLDSPYYGGSTFYDGPSTPRGFFDDGFWVR